MRIANTHQHLEHRAGSFLTAPLRRTKAIYPQRSFYLVEPRLSGSNRFPSIIRYQQIRLVAFTVASISLSIALGLHVEIAPATLTIREFVFLGCMCATFLAMVVAAATTIGVYLIIKPTMLLGKER